MSVDTFYDAGAGDRLVNPSCYPSPIKTYLADEEDLLNSQQGTFTMMVEVGCMEGRYLIWAKNAGKRYLGLDVVPRYIREGRRRASSGHIRGARFELCDARLLYAELKRRDLIPQGQLPIFVYPFNSFGNMDETEKVIVSLLQTRFPFLIFSYGIDDLSTAVRQEYYGNCQYRNLRIQACPEGVRFISDDGLDTIAFAPRFLRGIFRDKGLFVYAYRFSEVGVCYSPLSIDLPQVGE